MLIISSLSNFTLMLVRWDWDLFSRTLSKSERRYDASKLKFLALKWAITDHCQVYLYGGELDVYTGNNPLTYILTTAKFDAMGQQWVASLANYNFKLHCKYGEADALSCIPWKRDEDNLWLQCCDRGCTADSSLFVAYTGSSLLLQTISVVQTKYHLCYNFKFVIKQASTIIWNLIFKSNGYRSKMQMLTYQWYENCWKSLQGKSNKEDPPGLHTVLRHRQTVHIEKQLVFPQNSNQSKEPTNSNSSYYQQSSDSKLSHCAMMTYVIWVLKIIRSFKRQILLAFKTMDTEKHIKNCSSVLYSKPSHIMQNFIPS